MPESSIEQPERYWFARHSKSIIFLIGILTVIGVYEALRRVTTSGGPAKP